jgi:CheY-like chemotaxis protein
MSDRNLTPRAKRHTSPGSMASRCGGRLPRVVVVDDEPWLAEMIELLIQEAFSEVTILTFQNRDTAWQELLRADPDLLITDMNNHNVPGRPEYMGMSGWELLPRLAERAVKYPILVASGSFGMAGWEGRARAAAGRSLNITFMSKPFTMAFFVSEVRRMMRGGGVCGRRFPKG